MIHAFALEPELVATWGALQEFRFIHDKFGLGTPRVMLEMPAFSKWKKAVYTAATTLGLSDTDMKRLEALFVLFSEHKCRRANQPYDGNVTWLENAEQEYARQEFSAILAARNPRAHPAVLLGHQLSTGSTRWARETGVSPSRTPESIAAALAEMIVNSKLLHLIDPHFGPENSRYRNVLQALMNLCASRGRIPEAIVVHCSDKATLESFERSAIEMTTSLPLGCEIAFVRWREHSGGEKLHNRYVLTDLGGVSLGIGLDAGNAAQTDDFSLLTRTQYERRWSQYVNDDGAFERVDTPASIKGTRP